MARKDTIRIPDKDPISPVEVAAALGCPVQNVYTLIYEGKFGAFNIGSSRSEITEFRIPLKNFVQYINGVCSPDLMFRFPSDNPLTPVRISKALQCSDQHVHNLILDGEFPNATNIARDGSYRPQWRIPLRDLVDFVNRRREGAFE